MTDFRTSFSPPPSEAKISLQTPVLALGSCFAQVMGQRLAAHKFPACINPFGVLFNPVSMARVLDHALAGSAPHPEHYVQREGLWRHFDVHSDLAQTRRDTLEVSLARTFREVADFLPSAQWLLLTLGTATVYRYRATGEWVANCHKVPGTEFDKEMLTVAEARAALEGTLTRLWEAYPALRVVLTVSPVRHLKDTLPMNGASKATLRVVAEELARAYPQRVQYFPAYELVMDDLRDYRFYASDMLHLSPVAHAYVWQKFVAAYVDAPGQEFLAAWEGIRRDLEHRPRHPEGAEHQAFLRRLLQKLDRWQGTVDVAAERAAVQQQLL